MFQDSRLFWFKLRPHYSVIWIALVVLVVGLIAAVPFVQAARAGDLEAHSRAGIIMVATITIAGVLIIGATSRLWFSHLHERGR
jgi:hypothetical protein